MTKSTRSTRARKRTRPHPTLRIHRGTGYWTKKIAGHSYYFGKVADDPKGEAAEAEYRQVLDAIKNGRDPDAPEKPQPDAFTIADLLEEYLVHQERRRDDGEISPRSFEGMHSTCKRIAKTFGDQRRVADLSPDDFGRLRKALAKTRKSVSLRNEMQRVRSVFKFGFENGDLTTPVRYGSKFAKPKLKQVRKERRQHREQHGDRMLDAAEIRLILSYLAGDEVIVGTDETTGEPIKVKAKRNPALRAMVLIGVNCAFGQNDLSELPVRSIDLTKGVIDFPRPKTEADRICPLWPETAAAIEEWLPLRRKPKDLADAPLLFLTIRGARWVKTGATGQKTDGIGQEFSKTLTKLRLKRKSVGFYALRHTFRTQADETLDPVAIDLIMGHTDTSMAANYRERISMDRLRAVTEHVRKWLFEDTTSEGGEE